MSGSAARAPSPSWNAQSTAPAAAATANSNRWFWVKFKPLVTTTRCCSVIFFIPASLVASALSSWWARKRPWPSRFAASLGGAAGRSFANGYARPTLQVNMRGRNQGLGPSGDNPSRKITSTPFVPTLGIRVLRGDRQGSCAGDDAGFAMVAGGGPLRCSTRRQASTNSRPSAQEHRPRRKRSDFSHPRCRPTNVLAANPGSQIDQALTYCDLGLSGSVGRSAELFPEAALNQTGETPDQPRGLGGSSAPVPWDHLIWRNQTPPRPAVPELSRSRSHRWTSQSLQKITSAEVA